MVFFLSNSSAVTLVFLLWSFFQPYHLKKKLKGIYCHYWLSSYCQWKQPLSWLSQVLKIGCYYPSLFFFNPSHIFDPAWKIFIWSYDNRFIGTSYLSVLVCGFLEACSRPHVFSAIVIFLLLWPIISKGMLCGKEHFFVGCRRQRWFLTAFFLFFGPRDLSFLTRVGTYTPCSLNQWTTREVLPCV